MNIMFLIFSFNVGGIERLLIDMSEELAKRKYNVSLCIINEDFDDNLLCSVSQDVDIVKLHRKVGDKASFKYMLKLADEVKRRKIDVLHCQGINCVIFSYLAKILYPKLVVINTVHDIGNYPSYSNIKLMVQNLILDKTIAISKVVEDEILSRNQDDSKVLTIYNAIDLSKFSLSAKRKMDSNIVLGNVARFYPAKKGQDVLVDAMDILFRQDVRNVICRFAGGIFKGQEDQYQKLCETVEQKNLCDKIVFCGGIDDVSNFLNDINIFVLPSRYEGFGIALIEALAMGIPVVASNIDGPKEIFNLAQEDGVDIGFLAEVGNSNDFSMKISNCISKYDEYDRGKIREFVKEHFSIEKMIDEHLEVYKSLIKGKVSINDN